MSYQMNLFHHKKTRFNSSVQNAYSSELPTDAMSYYIKRPRLNHSITFKKIMQPVLLLEKDRADKNLHRKLLAGLEDKPTIDQKLRVLNEYWKTAVLGSESSRTLTEIKDQLTKMIRIPDISLENDYIAEIKNKLKAETEYSKTLEQKLKVVTLKNVEVHSNFDQVNKQLEKWMELSSNIAHNKTPVLKFKEVLSECIKKDELVVQLQKNLQELKTSEDYLLGLVKKLQKFKNERRLERIQRHVGEKEHKENNDSDSFSSHEDSSLDAQCESPDLHDNLKNQQQN